MVRSTKRADTPEANERRKDKPARAASDEESNGENEPLTAAVVTKGKKSKKGKEGKRGTWCVRTA